MSTLREVLNARPKDRVIAAPGVYDMVSLRMAAAMGFEALYMTGYGAVASHLGLPDAGLASYADMVGRVEAMARMAGTPLIADGDTGYGGLLNVRHAVRGYERAGAAAIQLEDQEFPKKCGHTPDRRVIPAEEMVPRSRSPPKREQAPIFSSSPAPMRERQRACPKRSGAPALTPRPGLTCCLSSRRRARRR
jgi:2,3-dimethylmalate lyase